MTRAAILVAVVAVSACLDRRPVLPAPGVDVAVRVKVGRVETAAPHACTCCQTPPAGASCVCPSRGGR